MSESGHEDHTITGDASAAVSWITESALSDEDKSGLRGFIERFPDLTFFKDDADHLDHVEETDGVRLPPWFRDVRTTLAFAHPSMDFHVDAFDGSASPRGEYPERIWYRLGLGSQDDEVRETLFERAKRYLVGGWWASDRSMLTINLEDASDRRIYEFSMEDVWDDVYDERPIHGSMFPIFDSYVSMLEHVVEFKLEDDTTVRARD